ncbi:XRE family transcriptional regulator [Xanthomonas euvesicatoria]|nr:helix-turn-helix motif domain protein [Xanthomonas phage MYK3]
MSNNLYDLFEEDPTKASLLQVKAHVAIVIIQHVRANGLSQAEVGRLAKLTQPRVSDLMRGRLHLFSLQALLNFAHRIGVPTNSACDGIQHVLRLG